MRTPQDILNAARLTNSVVIKVTKDELEALKDYVSLPFRSSDQDAGPLRLFGKPVEVTN